MLDFKVCYSNNGASMRYVSNEYEPQMGEILLDAEATTDQLMQLFPLYGVLSRAEKLAALDAEYEPKLLNLVIAAGRVQLLTGISEEERSEDLAAIRQQNDDLLEEKRLKRSAIING